MALPPARFCNLVYWWCVRRIGDPDDRRRFDQALERGTEGEGDVWSPEGEMAAFEAAAAATRDVAGDG